MIDIYIAYDKYTDGEGFTIYRVCKNLEEAYRFCIEEDIPNAMDFRKGLSNVDFRLQKVSASRKIYKKIIKRTTIKPTDHLERMQFSTIIGKFFDQEEFETQIFISFNIYDEFWKIINYYFGKEIDCKDFSSYQEYETACSERDQKYEDFICNNVLFNKTLKQYMKEKYPI